MTADDYLYGLFLPLVVAAFTVRVGRGRVAGAVAVVGGVVSAWLGLGISVPWPWLAGAAVIVGGAFGLGLLSSTSPVVWVVAAIGCAGVLYTAGILSWAQLAVALAVGLATVTLLAREPRTVSGAIVVVAVICAGLLAAGCFRHSSDVPSWVFVAAAIVPLGIAGVPPWRRRYFP